MVSGLCVCVCVCVCVCLVDLRSIANSGNDIGSATENIDYSSLIKSSYGEYLLTILEHKKRSKKKLESRNDGQRTGEGLKK